MTCLDSWRRALRRHTTLKPTTRNPAPQCLASLSAAGVELVRGGDPLILRVFSSQLGLSSALAPRVRVEDLPARPFRPARRQLRVSDAEKLLSDRPAPSQNKAQDLPPHAFTLALISDPNADKTTLFDALNGLRAKTRLPGTTVERQVGTTEVGRRQIGWWISGLYSLENSSPEEKIASDALRGRLQRHPAPKPPWSRRRNESRDGIFLVGQVLELDCPVIVALNMMDTARRNSIRVTWRNSMPSSAVP